MSGQRYPVSFLHRKILPYFSKLLRYKRHNGCQQEKGLPLANVGYDVDNPTTQSHNQGDRP